MLSWGTSGRAGLHQPAMMGYRIKLDNYPPSDKKIMTKVPEKLPFKPFYGLNSFCEKPTQRTSY